MKFVGSLRHVSGAEKLVVKAEKGVSVRSIVEKVNGSNPGLRGMLADSQDQDLTSNTLILVNGREINVLSGLETKLKNKDEVVLIPVAHGG